MTKEATSRLLEIVQKEFITQKRKSSTSTPIMKSSVLEKLGFDASEKKIVVGNLVLKKDMFLSDDYTINLIDKNNDLDGNPIKDNQKLLGRLQKLWEQGQREIIFEDLQKLKIWTPLTTIKIGNFELSSALGLILISSGKYHVSLLDESQDAYGRWTDKAVNHKRIVQVLDCYKFTKSQMRSYKETTLNTELEKHFRKYFDNVNKSKGNLRGIFDLEIGNLSYVIEIKIASAAKKTDQRDRAYGQMKRYLDEFKSKNYMLLIAGDKVDIQDTNIKSLKKSAEKEFGVHYYYLDAE